MYSFAKQAVLTRRKLPLAIFLIAWTIKTVAGFEAAAGPYLLVNGQSSQNVVQFDLTTGEATVFAEYPGGPYPIGTYPRNLVVREDGAIFASMLAGTQNVVQLVEQPGSSVRQAVSFSPSVGRLGTAQLAIYENDVFVAGDGARHIFRYDGQTGTEIARFSVTGSNNIRGMTIKGSMLYYAEVFQNTVRMYDLTLDPLVGGTLIDSSPHLYEPSHLTIGHTGNLLISSRQSTLVQEFDPITGQFLGTFIDIADFEPVATGNYRIEYMPEVDSYFVSTGRDRVYQLGLNGELTRILQSDLLDVVIGTAFLVPEPPTAVLALPAFVAALAWRRKRGLAASRSGTA